MTLIRQVLRHRRFMMMSRMPAGYSEAAHGVLQADRARCAAGVSTQPTLCRPDGRVGTFGERCSRLMRSAAGRMCGGEQRCFTQRYRQQRQLRWLLRSPPTSSTIPSTSGTTAASRSLTVYDAYGATPGGGVR